MKKQEIWQAADKPPIRGWCDGCNQYTTVFWYEGHPKGYSGERRFVGAFCSDVCAKASGEYRVIDR